MRDELMPLATHYFLPWRGQFYEDGYRDGKRLLILGESHYIADPADITPAFTQNVVAEFLASNGHPYRRDLFGRLHRMLTGTEDPTEAAARQAWARVAYANYIPVSVGTSARARKAAAHWSLATDVFPALLDELQPDRILVFGKATWNHINHGEWIDRTWTAGGKVRGLWRIDTKSRPALATWISHPSWIGNVSEMTAVLISLLTATV